MAKLTKADILKKALIEAMEKSLGIVTLACKTVGLSRQTYYEYYKLDPLFKKRIDSISEMTLDFGESALHKKIAAGSDACIIFFLKTKGKQRGYIERSEVVNIEPPKSEAEIDADIKQLENDLRISAEREN